MNLSKALLEYELVQVLAPASRVTGAAASGAIDLSDVTGTVLVTSDVAAASAGTNPTFNLKVQSAEPAAVPVYADVEGLAFAQVTNARLTQKLYFDVKKLGKKTLVKLVPTVGGTDNPAFLSQAQMLVYRKYPIRTVPA